MSWTLVYEVFFYAIFAVALLLGSSRLATALVAAGVIGVLFVMGLIFGGYNSFLGNPIVLEFCFGMLLAYAFYRHGFPTAIIRYGWLGGFILLCVAPVYVQHASTNGLPSSVRWALWGIPASLVVAFSGPLTARSLWRRIAVLIGDASYAIYLTHPLVMVAYARILKSHPTLTATSQLPFVPLVFLISLVGGVIAHLVIERHLVDLARYFLVPRKLGASVAP